VEKTVFTVGHSNHEPERFLKLLTTNSIHVVADTRSYPYSKYVPQFDMPALKDMLRDSNLKYLFLGDELGGRPAQDEFYDTDGRVLYGRVASSPRFLRAIGRLEQGMERYRVALLCSEEDPLVCHRHLLIGRVLTERGNTVCHIRGDGSIQIPGDLASIDVRQRSLFDAAEDVEWKSLRSVSRRRPQRSSLGSSRPDTSNG